MTPVDGDVTGTEALAAAADAAIRAFAAARDPYLVDHTVQVTSFGGSGTTALCEHLLSAGVDLQKGPAQWPFKHRRTPPRAEEVPAGFRALYLVGDPRDAVLSVFRRKGQHAHYQALRGPEPDPAAAARLERLETFLSAGVDDFELADHVDRWLRHEPGYPVMFVRYERLAEVWPAVRDFVGLAPDHAALEGRARASDWRALPTPQRDQLDRMYGELAELIDGLPPAHVV